ncbi:hypothetical protein DFQ28_007902 [Apophysomyces sp. BC1034]|nr:hypothetical protein DFQ30_011347 [Apophysomyces sp. BC1015]KAG0175088.1 hypothetical protein DFQ29_007249 [Apophysomyces sp. BC1021]KAG0186426.1 hypothetical protein DFQ28_007902 [Apophysomyces sp. BC1034]
MDYLRQAVEEPFEVICSKDQLDLCIVRKSEARQLLTAYREWKRKQQTGHGMVGHDEQLIECVFSVRERYQIFMESHHIRPRQSDLERAALLDQLESLSQRLDAYGRAHEEMEILMVGLKRLRRGWERKTIETIVTSILASSSLDRCRVLQVTRAQRARLGLGLRSVNTPYLVFEASEGEDQCKAVVGQIALDFGRVFDENAAQNLARVRDCYRHLFQPAGDPTPIGPHVVQDIHRLGHYVFTQPPSASLLAASADELASAPIFDMARPAFAPAGWDWPYLLKYKRPQNASEWLQNLFRRKKKRRWNEHGHWSLSIHRLSDHFTKIGHDYYTNMLNNARLMHARQAHIFEHATHLLMDCYRALQIEHGHSNAMQAMRQLYRIQQETQRSMDANPPLM